MWSGTTDAGAGQPVRHLLLRVVRERDGWLELVDVLDTLLIGASLAERAAPVDDGARISSSRGKDVAGT